MIISKNEGGHWSVFNINQYYLGTILSISHFPHVNWLKKKKGATLQTMKQCLTGLAAGYTKSLNMSSLSKSHPGYDDNRKHSADNVMENQKNKQKENMELLLGFFLLFLCCHDRYTICHRNMSENSVN